MPQGCTTGMNGVGAMHPWIRITSKVTGVWTWARERRSARITIRQNIPLIPAQRIALLATQPDFVVYNTSLAGSSSQATIVAFDNLYSSCTGGTPLTYWAYNTGTTGAVVTSPVLSYDGTQVAFVQNTATSANLVILRWKADRSTLTNPTVPSAGPCTAATAPCMITIPFSTANSDPSTLDTTSSPFYDYSHDVIYVGDTSGFLHKFTTVFTGTPTEVVSTGPTTIWPANLDSPYDQLNSPVYVYGYNRSSCGRQRRSSLRCGRDNRRRLSGWGGRFHSQTGKLRV